MSLLRSAVCICMYGCNTVFQWFSRLILRSCGIPGTGGRSSAAQRGAQQEKERGRAEAGGFPSLGHTVWNHRFHPTSLVLSWANRTSSPEGWSESSEEKQKLGEWVRKASPAQRCSWQSQIQPCMRKTTPISHLYQSSVQRMR